MACGFGVGGAWLLCLAERVGERTGNFGAVNTYAIWVNLAPGAKDLELVAAVNAYLGALQKEGTVASWSIQRRQFGFGPAELGEFMIQIRTQNLTQLEAAFTHAARRSGELERLHVEVYSRVQNFRSALYRDFPDAVRVS